MYEKTSPSDILKDVNKLGLRPEIAKQAEKLMEQLEYPVVFWMDAPTDKNYAGLHPENPTQYWITIQPQTEQSELERIVLANLYKQIQIRRRYLMVMPVLEYVNRLTANPERLESFSELIEKINATAASLECEIYLSQFGIKTSQTVRENMFQDRMTKLREYIDIQHDQPGWYWYPEIEIMNLIDYGFYGRLDKRYQYHLEKWVAKIKPKAAAKRCRENMRKVQKLIEDICRQYTGENGEETINKMRQELVSIFRLQGKVQVKPMNAEHRIDEIEDRAIDIYTFIPEGCPNEELLLQNVRFANECLGLYREVTFFKQKYPVVCIAISYDKGANIYSFGNRTDGYCILIFADVLLKLEQIVLKYSTEEPFEKISNSVYIRNKLMKYVMYFITLHEYAHILHGDCDNLKKKESQEERIKKEKLADEFAERNLRGIVRFQYRGEAIQEFLANNDEDRVFMVHAKKIASELRK